MTSTPPLADITVVSLEQAVAAPYATRQLADLGARIIKIERPGGGDFARGYDQAVHGNSSYFVWLNRGKQSLTLDLKSADGLALLEELLAGADVLVQNLGPGAAARMGLGPAALASRHPRLIACSVTGWGSTGPWAGRKAYDLLAQCEAGLLSITGTPAEKVKAGISVADIAAGMFAYSGILTALLRRATTGQVGAVELAVQNEREWRGLCANVLGDPALADDPRFVDNTSRVAHRAELNAIISARLAALPATTATALLDDAGVAHAGINDVVDLSKHPVLSGRDRWHTVAVPGGTVQALRPPADLSGVEPVWGPVPSLGEHTEAILRELGHGDRVADLRARRVV
jgi:formyl-CoA transferase